MPRYESAIINQHAQNLYDKADNLIWEWAISSGLSGGVGGAAIAVVLHIAKMEIVPPLYLIIGIAVVCAAIAAAAAQQEAFKLRLQAQQVLCQMMIERNTAQIAQQLEEIRLRGMRAGAGTATPTSF